MSQGLAYDQDGGRVRLLFVINQADFFLSHKLPVARAALAAGYEVHVAAPVAPEAAAIQAEGLIFHPVALDRRSLRVWDELFRLRDLYALYRALRPDLVHHFTIKPVIYGGLAARMARVPAVVSAVTGLGYVFLHTGFKAALLKSGVTLLYRLALHHPRAGVIFQNPDDLALFRRRRLVDAGAAVIIKGSGVDMQRFALTPEPGGPPVVLFASRMLWDKGVREYVEAARLLRAQGIKVRLVMAGQSDPHSPAAVPTAQLQAWHDSGLIEWWGHCDDMPAAFAKAHVVCLPSYREGLPKVLVEAAASGRAIVTTDVPGCREVVRHGENGLCVPVRDAAALAGALKRLIEDAPLRQRMAARGRCIAEAEFSVEQVVRETLALYQKLLSGG
ncbi:MAG: glycosyltransferase family 4 protein [Anaerolineae bacterium]|nr:glycosyltransferase family 4 protein [Anaerolineae bacterium]